MSNPSLTNLAASTTSGLANATAASANITNNLSNLTGLAVNLNANITAGLANATNAVGGVANGLNTLSNLSNNVTGALNNLTNSPNGLASSISSSLSTGLNTAANFVGNVANGLANLTNLATSIGNSVTAGIDMVTGLSANITGGLAGLTNFASNVTAALMGLITTPFPAQSPIVPLDITPYQVSPYMEKVTVDPYRTYELNILSETQLMVDDLVDYLSSVLPPDLINALNTLPALISFLNATGNTLAAVISTLAGLLPAGVSLVNLIRFNPFMDILYAIDAFVDGVSQTNCPPTEFNNVFCNNAFQYIASAKYVSNISRPNLAKMSIYVGKVASNAAYPVSNISVLANSNVATKHVVQLTKTVSAVKFNIVATNLAKLGTSKSTKLINHNSSTLINTTKTIADNLPPYTAVVNSKNSLGRPNTTKLINALNTSKTATTGLLTAIPILSMPIVHNVANIIKIGTITAIPTLITTVTHLNPINLQAELSAIKLTDIDTYQLTHTNPDYTDLYNSIKTYGIDNISGFVTGLTNTSQATINSLVINIDALGVDNNYKDIVAIIQDKSYAVVNTAVTSLAINSISDLNTALNQVDTINAIPPLLDNLTDADTTDLATVVNTAIVGLTINPLLYTLIISATIDTALLTTVIPDITALSSNDIVSITKQMVTSEPYNLLLSSNISGVILTLAITKSLQAAAEAGNVKMVADLVINYNGTLTKNYRLYLITTLLANYKETDDEILLGQELAASNLIALLDIIHPTWLFTSRGNNLVYNHYPWLTASKDALKVLLYFYDTAMPSILQSDNKYSITI